MTAPRRRHRGIRNSAELTKGRTLRLRANTAEERRKTVRYTAGQAVDADDCRSLLDALGLDPADGRP